MQKNNTNKDFQKPLSPSQRLEYKMELLPEADYGHKISDKLFKKRCILTCDHSGIERVANLLN